MSKDYYKSLGVDKGATDDQIKKAYRKMAMKYHPDKNSGDAQAEAKFKEVAEAYDVLSTPDKKANYDRFGTTENFSGGGGFGHGFDMNDIFSQFGDIFGSFGGRQQQRQKRGADLRLRLVLTIEDILKGAKKKIKYKKQTTCSTCSGKGGTDVKNCLPCNGSGRRIVVQNSPFGQIRQETYCPDCQGSGKKIHNACNSCHGDGTTIKEETVEAEIPAGVSSGMQLTMRGYGNDIRDGVPGDLQILIEEERDFSFKRENNNLIVEKEVSVIDAILGKHLDVKTPHGDIPITIEAGTEHGKSIRISGLGIPDVNLGLGDLYVIVKIKIPKNLSTEEKETLEKLKDSKNFEV